MRYKLTSALVLLLLISACGQLKPEEQKNAAFMEKISSAAMQKVRLLPAGLRVRIRSVLATTRIKFELTDRHPIVSLAAADTDGLGTWPGHTLTIFVETWQEYVRGNIVQKEALPDLFLEILLYTSYLREIPNSNFWKSIRTREAIHDESLAYARLATQADLLEANGITISGNLRRKRRMLQRDCRGKIPCPAIEEYNWKVWQLYLRQAGRLPQ